MDKKSPSGIDPSLLNKPIFGSDLIASALREQEFPYVCLNPGASYRGLHDSIVNFLGNTTPEMALVLHEEHAVSIAHGYARAAERPLAVIVHSNVGLMHATMSIFNAWCDRLPMVILGATGPVDAASAGPISTGYIPRPTRAHWSATTPNGMISRARRGRRSKRSGAAPRSP